jgi:hypothetical protein
VGKAKADIDADPGSVDYALGELEGTGWWRSTKAAEYPDDNRNTWATECVEKVISSAANISDAVQKAFDEAMAKLEENEDAAFSYCAEANDYRKSVGFGAMPETADEYLTELTEIANRALELTED